MSVDEDIALQFHFFHSTQSVFFAIGLLLAGATVTHLILKVFNL